MAKKPQTPQTRKPSDLTAARKAASKSVTAVQAVQAALGAEEDFRPLLGWLKP